MALLTPIVPALTGAAPTLAAAAAGGDTFQNNGRMLLMVTNGGGAPINVTIDDPGSTAPANATAFNPDVVVAVPAGQTRVIGPFPPNRFNDANGLVAVSYSGVTTVTVGVLSA